MNNNKRMIGSALLISLLATPVLAKVNNDTIGRNHILDEVVVTGSRNAVTVRNIPMTVSVLHKDQIFKRYDQSLLPLMTEQVPGLFITGRGIMGYSVSGGAAGSMSLRGVGGGPTTGLLVLIDGHPQYMGLMGHPIADAYQSMLAEKVEVVSGPASILYGSNAMGGVVNIVTRKQLMDGISKFNSVVSLNYNCTDGHREDMGFEQFGGYAKVGYDFSSSWKAFADVNLIHFTSSNPGTISTPMIDNDANVTRGMASFSLENNYERTSGAFKFFYNWGRHKINDGYKPGAEPLDFRFNSKDLMLGVTWYQTVSLLRGNQTTFGFDYQHFGGEAWNQYPDKRLQTADKTLNEIAGYINVRQQLGDRFTVNAGIRADHHEEKGTEWIPQVGATWAMNGNSVLKAVVSKGFRNPTIREMYMFPPKNPDLKPESLMNYELSFMQQLWDNAFSYHVNVYYIKGSNTIISDYVDGKLKNLNSGKLENYGVELSARYRLSKSFAISGNYSWLHMKHKVIAAPEHKLYIGGDYQQGRWSASTGVQYIRHLYTAIKPQVLTENFLLWNVRAAYSVCRNAELFVKGENLLGQHYEINAGFPMPKATVMGGINLHF